MRYWKKETMNCVSRMRPKQNRKFVRQANRFLSLFTAHSTIEIRACTSTGWSGRCSQTGICEEERKVNTVLALDWTGRGWVCGKEWGRVRDVTGRRIERM
jgi:hypothetical protein